jgi:ABC-type transport system involved in multi-copper enzyme maturation permease subunit
MLSLFTSELFRLRKRPQSWLLLVIAFVVTGMFYAGFAIGARVLSGTEREELVSVLPFSELPDFGLSIGLLFIGSVMLVIVASGMMGNEFAWNTLRPLVARARSRGALMGAKILAVLAYAVVFTVAMALLTAGLAVVASLVAGIDIGFSGQAALGAAWFTLRSLVANLPYVALAFLLATWAKSNAAGIAGALGVMFLEPIVFSVLSALTARAEAVASWGIAQNAQEMAVEWAGDAGSWRQTGILLAYSALFFAVSFAIFLRRDVTSG